MRMRVGTVTNIYPTTGKVKVMYEDAKNASLPLAMLTMNQEYSMPSIGDRVVTMHMENGSSKGFVLGTYYGGGMQPKANAGYRKDFGGGAYAVCRSGAYRLSAKGISLIGNSESLLSLDGDVNLAGTTVMIGSIPGSEEGELEETEPDVYMKLLEKEIELQAVSKISILSESGAVEIASEGKRAHLILDSEAEIKAEKLIIEAENLSLRCSYGEDSFENILRRIERIEDLLGIPHATREV